MKPILELEKNIHLLENAKDSILQRWTSYEEALAVLEKHKMPSEHFIEYFASSIFDYFIGVVKKEKEIGDCPVMSEFLNYLKERDVSSSELFLVCTHFRKSILDELFDQACISKGLFNEISYVFDQNFSGVLDQYSDRLYKAQTEIKTHQRRFEEYNAAIDQSAMVSKVDKDGLITYANPRYSELSGYTQKELLGKPIQKLNKKAEPSSLYEEMWEDFSSKEIFQAIVEYTKKDGTPFFVESTIVPMFDVDGSIQEHLCIAYDVTELVKVRDEALEAERTKDRFLSNMSHEIRTPLNAILGFVAILKKRIEGQENTRYLGIIENSGKNLLSIIADILDFAKIREGKLNIEEYMFDPTKELYSTIALFNSKMIEKGIEYLAYIDPRLPNKIKGDSVRIQQILANFLSNAEKFTPEMGSVFVSIEFTDANLEIKVKDSGCGMDREAIGRVFSEFEQAESSTTRKYGGTGLGLSICQNLSDMMNAKISVESELGKGSSFSLSIPVEASKERNTYTPHKVYVHKSNKHTFQLLRRYLDEMGMILVEEASADSVNFYDNEFSESKTEPSITVGVRIANQGLNSLASSFSAYEVMDLIQEDQKQKPKYVNGTLQYAGHILIADDNRANQLLMQLVLDEYGLSHVLATNGKEAYEKFQQERFDLVLMDEHMPVMGGLEATHKIMEYEHDNKLKHTPIISVTASALKQDKEGFLEAGMDGYVSKPLNTIELEEVLSKYLQYQGENMSYNTELPSYENISVQEMSEKIGLNMKHIPILVESFTGESQGLLDQLEAAIASKNYGEISSTAHSIKGSSGNLKFDEMYELAKEIELSAKAKKEDFPYLEACASLKAAIKSISL